MLENEVYNRVSRLYLYVNERQKKRHYRADLEVEGVRYIEMHRGPATYVLGPPEPPRSRSRDLELLLISFC